MYSLCTVGVELYSEYSKALATDPRNFKSLFNRGFMVHLHCFRSQATQRRCSLAQTTSHLQFLKGRKYPQAFADFSRAVELEPGNAYVRYNLGVCMLVNQARKRHVCCTSTECLTFAGPPCRS